MESSICMRFAGVTIRLNAGPILLPDLCYHHSALPTAETGLLSVPQTHMRIPPLASLATPPSVWNTLPTGFFLPFTFHLKLPLGEDFPTTQSKPDTSPTHCPVFHCNPVRAFISICCPLLYLLVCLLSVSPARM